MIHFILYSRSYCHLCDDMLTALRTELGTLAADISVFDVDEDPLLLEKYDELVPVLTGRHDLGPERELGHYFLDTERLSQFIAAQP
ncbi:Glutaredoxin 2 [Oxalobacteraceae bacterium IMCC9480]|nr:Glutaredoxin 2 [Oxalobacteraceae bacterium IMCC9480]